MNSFDQDYLNKYGKIIGIDEAGRGPLAGPVFTAAVYVDSKEELKLLSNIGADSKKLSEKERIKRFNFLIKNFKYDINYSDESVIDEINILRATNLSMIKNLKKLDLKDVFLMVDGKNFYFDDRFECVIKGDEKSSLIGAASILAKVSRDNYMITLDERFPEFEFKRHKGYPTKKHIENVLKYGIIKDYRITFNPIKKFLIENKVKYNKNDFSKYRLIKLGIL
ncbi:ribonuclease HII [Geotoga petraea]|jgi:ribonuclease HII|uniref:Ribonuclease n=1 Tax=Geotoga petraea TaxID=28234 RepID=A0A1G6IJT0_9BACT|nr:ribonuclease HII [Geotoga petraea]MDK2945278.1 ribonuclease [Geotoga sp.]TGG89224.1 ribonuclease HII [Geotoga petraea]SDC06748.1 RNase HII [Geotoga petraea]